MPSTAELQRIRVPQRNHVWVCRIACAGKAKGLKACLEHNLARPSVKETTPPPIPGRG